MSSPLVVDAPRQFTDAASSLLDTCGATGALHAQSLDTGRSVDLHADAPVVTASVFKIPILVELHRQADAGRLRLSDRAEVMPADRVFGPTGLSCFTDPTIISLRDLAVLMISISDNTATDVLLHRVGLDNVNRSLLQLGLTGTQLTGSCRDLLNGLVADIGLRPTDDPARTQLDPTRLQNARALRPDTTTHSTPRETTALLALIWQDQAASTTGCAQIRQTLGTQAWAHGIRAGLEPGMSFAGKSGTLPGVRNEAGVITTADGERIALAVFLRYPATRLVEHRPDIDTALADLGRLAVRALREDRS